MTGKKLKELVAGIPDEAAVLIGLVKIADKKQNFPLHSEEVLSGTGFDSEKYEEVGYTWFEFAELEEFSEGFEVENTGRLYLVQAGEIVGDG